MTGDRPAQRRRWRRYAAGTVVVLLLLAPVVVLSASPWQANAMWVFFGMLPSAMGVLVSVRHAAVTAVATGALVAAALALTGVPWAGGLLMAGVGAVTGLSSLRGWHLIGAAAGPSIAVALISHPFVAVPGGTVEAAADPATIFVAAGFVAAGGLWVALLGVGISRALPSRPHARTAPRTAAYFAVGLGAAAGVLSYICLRWLDPMSWWLVLTVFVVMRPVYVSTRSRTVSRVAGTVIGAIAAAAIVELFHDAPVMVTILAFASGAVAVYANLKAPYWVYAAFLTPAVVLQTPSADGSLTVIIERAGYTVIGAAVAVIVTVIGHALLIRHSPDQPAERPGAA